MTALRFPSLTIRLADMDDVETLAQLYLKIRGDYLTMTQTMPEDYLVYMEEQLSEVVQDFDVAGKEILVAENNDGQVIGLVEYTMEDHGVHFAAISVEENMQKAGTELCRRMVDRARQLNAPQITTDARHDMVGYCEKRGFHVTGGETAGLVPTTPMVMKLR